MTIKHIKDDIESLCLFIAMDSYYLGMRHGASISVEDLDQERIDDIKDELSNIIDKNI